MAENQVPNYSWAADEKFEISGKTLEALLKVLQVKLQTKEAQEAILAFETGKLLESVISAGIESGKIKDSNTEGIPSPATDGPTLKSV